MGDLPGTAQYVFERSGEFVTENEKYFWVDYYVDWAKGLSSKDRARIHRVRAVECLDGVVESLTDISFYDNFNLGLGTERDNELRMLIRGVAKEHGIAIKKLSQALILRGSTYMKFLDILKGNYAVLNELEQELFDEGRFSRFIVEQWLVYIYLGLLFLKEL